MAKTLRVKLARDVRINADGVPASNGRLYLRGETVQVHSDYADDVTNTKTKAVMFSTADKQVTTRKMRTKGGV